MEGSDRRAQRGHSAQAGLRRRSLQSRCGLSGYRQEKRGGSGIQNFTAAKRRHGQSALRDDLQEGSAARLIGFPGFGSIRFKTDRAQLIRHTKQRGGSAAAHSGKTPAFRLKSTL